MRCRSGQARWGTRTKLTTRTVPQAPGSATSSCSEGLEFYGIAKIGQAFK
jgi:hypothetical protein